MGVYSDFLAHTGVVDVTGEKVANQRTAYGELAKHAVDFDPVAPTYLGALDAIQVINAFTPTVTSGNFKVTIVDQLGTSHLTANIAYNANAATIETAIDVKMTSDAYSGWTNGDISVALGTDLVAGAATLTFDGASVTEKNMGQTTITDISLTGGGTVNGATTDTPGSTTNEVQTVNTFLGSISGGNFTITILDDLAAPHLTANIAYNANAATVEGAIDTIMTSDAYSGWTNGDISVTLGTDLTAGDATLTFDGDSVTGKDMGQTSVTDADLLGGNTVNGATTGTPGITTNEVQVINVFVGPVTGGNFTINVVDELGVNHVTASIVYNANAATIESTIDSKMTADGYGSWSNGDITVALTGDITANNATLTYDGASVTGKDMGQVTVADVDLSGGGTVNGTSTDTPGITTNEVQTVNTFYATVSGGNYTINIIDEVAGPHLTANIAYNANAATIETAIDVKMTSDAYGGWTNGDISVSLTGDLTGNDATLTYDGASVTGKNMGQVAVADVDLLGGQTVNGATTGTPGLVVSEVQTVTQMIPTVSGGNFTINIVDELAGPHLTANIAYDATASEIETAIDVKMTSDAYSGWTNGDISVALGTDLVAGDATLTFSGDSVTGKNQGQTAIADVDLVAAGTVNGQSETTSGQAKRYAWAVMWAHGMVTSVPDQGDALATGVGLEATPATSTAHWPRPALRKLLALQASIDDGNVTLRGQLETLFRVE